MEFIFIIVFVFLLYYLLVVFIVSLSKHNTPNDKHVQNTSQELVYNMISLSKIQECAKEMQQKDNLTDNESVYFAITSLCAFIISSPALKTDNNIRRLTSVVETNFPQMSPLIIHAISGNFDFVEHIAYNAKIIAKDENKTRREAIYLSICTFYDDLVQKKSKQGIGDLMQAVKIIYPELLNEILTYIAWKYESRLAFKTEFDEEMRKRHSCKE